MNATCGRPSVSASVRTGGMRRRANLRLTVATSPPRTTSTARRQARLKRPVPYARPRERPLSVYAE
jgi:hypothetical protein